MSINFLFDKSFLPYATPDTICDSFQVSKRTVAQKAKLIRDMFKLGYFDPEFSTDRMAKNNPLAGLTMVDGFLVIREPQFRDSDQLKRRYEHGYTPNHASINLDAPYCARR